MSVRIKGAAGKRFSAPNSKERNPKGGCRRQGSCRRINGKDIIPLDQLVRRYKSDGYMEAEDADMNDFASMNDKNEAVRRAASGQFARGDKIRPHSYRVTRNVRREAYDRVFWTDIQRAPRSFPDMHAWLIRKYRFKGFGELSLYDFATFVWVILGRGDEDIEAVYIKKGTGDGLRALETKMGKKLKRLKDGAGCAYVPRSEFPAQFDGLSSMHIENLLCIYADRI